MAQGQGDREGTPAGSADPAVHDGAALERFFDRAPSLFAITDDEGRLRRVNAAWERVLGYRAAELLGREWYELIHPDDLEASLAGARELHESAGSVEAVENRFRHSDGSFRWLRWTAIYRSADALVYLVGDDVTELKSSDDSRRRYREQLERSEEVAQLGNWAIDFSTDLVTASPGLARLAGVMPDELEAPLEDALELILPEDRPTVADLVERLRAGAPVVRQRYRGKRVADGALRVLDGIAYAELDSNGRATGAYGVVQDVTERVEAEEREREASDMERAAFHDAPLGVCLVDLDSANFGRFLRVNRAFSQLVDQPQAELLERSVQDVVHPDDWPMSRDNLASLASGERASFSIEKRYFRRDGEMVWIVLHASAFHLAGRETLVALEQMEDITDRKRAERELIESRRILQTTIDAAPAAIFVKDLDGRYLVVNEQLARSQALNPADIVGRRDEDLFPPEAVERWEAKEREALAVETAVTTEEWIPSDEGDRLYLTQLFALRDADGRPYAIGGTGTDITDRVAAEEERLRLEASLQQSQRLETVGRLAGGIAHDFNNLLAVIGNYSRLAAGTVPADSSAAADLAEVSAAADRAAELTHELVVFSRQEIVKPRVLDPNDVVVRTERLLRRTIGEDVELRLELGEEVPAVEVDPGQLERVLMNLAVNARDAMPTGGTLKISTAAVADPGGAGEGGETGAHRSARLAVCDSGQGMTAEVARRAFEPFFTTKPQGEGTGLGLATVHGIVTQAGGTLELETAPDQGTTVSFELPASERANDPVSPRRMSARPMTGEDRRILVVEDDEAVRRLVVRLLRKAGYAVVDTTDPEHALREVETLEGSLDLLLTDLVMPHMSGRELSERLRAERPDLDVVYMSGYTPDVVLRHGIAESEVRMLTKPFTRDDLLTAVGDALREGRGL